MLAIQIKSLRFPRRNEGKLCFMRLDLHLLVEHFLHLMFHTKRVNPSYVIRSTFQGRKSRKILWMRNLLFEALSTFSVPSSPGGAHGDLRYRVCCWVGCKHTTEVTSTEFMEGELIT